MFHLLLAIELNLDYEAYFSLLDIYKKSDVVLDISTKCD